MGTRDYNKEKGKTRNLKHKTVRKKVKGTSSRPRLTVFKSNKNMNVQIVDDSKGVTLVSASTLEKEIRSQIKFGGNIAAAKKVGEIIGKRAIEKGIKSVCFDRGCNIYHGRVKAVAESARETGLEF